MTRRAFAALIRRQNQYLVLPPSADDYQDGFSLFPGGCIEGDETLLRAARREVARVFEVRITAVSWRIFAATDPSTGLLVEYVPVSIAGEPRVHKRPLDWRPLDELAGMALTPSDRGCVEFLKAQA